MIVAIFGVPTALSLVGCSIIKAIVERAEGPHQQIAAIFIDDLRKAWTALGEGGRKQVLIFSELPSTPLLDLMRSSQSPTIVFLDDFDDVVNQLVQTRSMTTRTAIRHTTRVLCAIDQVRKEDALRVTPIDCDRPLKAFVASLCEFLQVGAADQVTREVMALLGYAESSTATLDDHIRTKSAQTLSAASGVAPHDDFDRATLQFVADQYAGVGAGVGVARIAWPTELFYRPDPPQDFLDGPTDLVGPARLIAFGPYLHLPKGEWTVSITIEVEENFSGNELQIDVYSGSILVAGETSLPVSGVFGIDLAFKIVEPFDPVEVRSQILSGAIEGRLTLREVVFQRGGTQII